MFAATTALFYDGSTLRFSYDRHTVATKGEDDQSDSDPGSGSEALLDSEGDDSPDVRTQLMIMSGEQA